MVVEILLILILGIAGSSFAPISFQQGGMVTFELLGNLNNIDVIIW